MSNFNHLHWDREKETIDIGAGLRWDHVYDYLNPQGYTVVGGRVRGVGVAGFILGGGKNLQMPQRTENSFFQ
jgi:FAD/FMN-containing dehydrogenase